MSDAFLAKMEASLGGVPANFASFEPQAVTVGQDVSDAVCVFGNKIKTGPGLAQVQQRVVATQAGELCFAKPNIFWVHHPSHRYVPRLHDNVIGVVLESFAENYKMDIVGTSTARLPTLAFDGASKRNRPNLGVGSLVFGRVSQVHRDMEPELSCMATGSGPRKDWMTGESMYGELKGGFVFRCSLALAEELMDPESTVLLALAASIPFEIAVGANGFVWVNAADSSDIILITTAIKHSENTPVEKIPGMVQGLLVQNKRNPTKSGKK
jgi:exosome complex component RRP40